MPRKQRIHYDGALYHVIARGNNGEYILKNDEDKTKYIELIQRYKERYGFKLYAYCIMDNHIHMLVEVEKVPLNKIMQGIQLVYTQIYNRKNKRTGHVFQQRYKAVVCNKDGYLLHLTKYIHMNPVKAHMTEDVNYEWSSYKEYANGKNGLVDTDFVLKILSNNKSKAIGEYNIYMKEEDGDIEQVEYEVTEAQKGNIDKTKYIGLDKLIEEILEQEKVTFEQIREKTKKQKISDIRKVIVILAEKNCKTSSTELANKLNIPISRISKIRAGEIMMTVYMDEVIGRWNK
ncbi:MAG TPA: transposase [Clostridiales bacterium]|nr:MAG: hypothetical protein A2Y22_03335 [Clostridiales bacterium GWD2_32_59]HAN09338.1 transposase [Clostridiales bacterium]